MPGIPESDLRTLRAANTHLEQGTDTAPPPPTHAVKTIQQFLNVMRRGYALFVDGVFGPKTREAVKEFQRQNMCKVDGIVGPETLAKMIEVNKGKSK